MTENDISPKTESSPERMSQNDILKALSRIPSRGFLVTRWRLGAEIETETIVVTAQKHEIDASGALLFSNLHFIPEAPESLATYIHRVFASGHWLEVEEVSLPKPSGLAN